MVKVSAIVLASGRSKRFGSDKLEYVVNGKRMIDITIERLMRSSVEKIILVTRNDEIIARYEGSSVICVKNEDTTDDTAITIKLGMERLSGEDGVMLCVSDEPYLKLESIENLISDFASDLKRGEENIRALAFQGEQGNPVLFPKKYFLELASLQPNERGKTVIKRHLSHFRKTEVTDEIELCDLDKPIN